MKKCIYPFLSIMFFSLSLNGQTVNEAVRYSNLNYSGTARTAGVAFSFGSMGGDFGVATINPAGISDFSKSEVMLSPSLNGINNTSILRQSGLAPFEGNVNSRMFLENVGVVIHGRPIGKLLYSNFSIGLNQIGNYTENFEFEGKTEGSITERFVQLGNGNSIAFGSRNPDFLDDFEAGLAYEVGAIFEDPNSDDFYVSDFIDSDLPTKRQEVSRTGRMNELSLTWAGKFRNKIGVGIGLGIPFLSFEELKTYTERDPDNEIPFFENLQYTERLATSGVGFNLKVGINTTLKKVIRLGLAYHTPTVLGLEDNYTTALRYSYTENEETISTNSESPDGIFEYQITTPSKFIGSVGTLLKIGQDIRGFVNADFEYKNFSANSFDLGGDSNEIEFQEELNNDIENELRAASNIKIGGELAYKYYRVRAGVNLIGSPYVDETTNSVSNLYSVGLGLRKDGFYIDLAYVADRATTEYSPYKVLDENRMLSVNTESSRNKLLFTFGIKL